MKPIVEARRKNWKEYLLVHLNSTKKPSDFIGAVIGYYLYYTKGTRELHQRLKGILYRMESQLDNIPVTRKGDFDAKWLKKVKEILKNAKLEIEKSRD